MIDGGGGRGSEICQSEISYQTNIPLQRFKSNYDDIVKKSKVKVRKSSRTNSCYSSNMGGNFSDNGSEFSPQKAIGDNT